jgi:hypothetical protein
MLFNLYTIMDVAVNNISNIPKHDNYDYINKIGTNPWSLFILTVILLVYYLIFSTLGGSNEDGGSTSNSPIKSFVFLEVIIWGVFIALLLLNGVYYFFDINITASIKNFFSNEPEIDIDVNGNNINKDNASVPEITKKKQVFHVPGNDLVYNDAKAICKAYGSRLATYDEVETTYNNGGEWCSYGWSDNQQALFPTQKNTWDNLQKIEGHEHDCGRQGVNGGYIANPSVRFGANCFGYKPQITNEEENAMKTDTLYPKTSKDLGFERRVDYWRQKLPEVTVAPFNKTTWSKI